MSGLEKRTLPEWLEHYNRAEIARRMGVTRQAVFHWHHGICSPRKKRLEQLAEAMRLGLEQILL